MLNPTKTPTDFELPVAEKATLRQVLEWVAFELEPLEAKYDGLYRSKYNFEINYPHVYMDFLDEEGKFQANQIISTKKDVLVKLERGRIVAKGIDAKTDLEEVIDSKIWLDENTEIDWQDSMIEVYNRAAFKNIWIATAELFQLFPPGKPKSVDSSKGCFQVKGYSTPYLEIMVLAIVELNITETYQPPKKAIIDFFLKHMPDLSGNMVNYMATMIRKPEAQKGGFWKG